MNRRNVGLVGLIIGVLLLSGCQKAQTTQTPDSGATSAPAAEGQSDSAPNPELDNVSRLTLGTFQLEGSDNAVTPEQAAKLLPLWKLVQGGTLKSDAETNAVVQQIEAQMTEAQLAAIDALNLTRDDMTTWMQEQGIEMPGPDGAPGDGQGAPGGMPDMTDEERAQMRERFENMTEEERATAMAESGFQPPDGNGQSPAGNGQPPAGGGPGMSGRGGGNILLEPLIKLLTERAAQ
ncbi:MAG TPA: hypothetical protein PLH19_03020 [Anaerolineae bacterium]|nr:hypothetical protein [Anaerolineae bacterium]HQH37492.1 hypothetical protein [Anaerolineae bacterium]